MKKEGVGKREKERGRERERDFLKSVSDRPQQSRDCSRHGLVYIREREKEKERGRHGERKRERWVQFALQTGSFTPDPPKHHLRLCYMLAAK